MEQVIIENAVKLLTKATDSRVRKDKFTACKYLKRYLSISVNDAVIAYRIATKEYF